MEYTNYKGEKKSLVELDHQHLSNIYWYNKILWDRDDYYLKFILDQINTRFEGKMLPYIPQWQFTHEIDYLDKMGFLNWNQEHTEADVIYDGHTVGHYIIPEKLREDKINELI